MDIEDDIEDNTSSCEESNSECEGIDYPDESNSDTEYESFPQRSLGTFFEEFVQDQVTTMNTEYSEDEDRIFTEMTSSVAAEAVPACRDKIYLSEDHVCSICLEKIMDACIYCKASCKQAFHIFCLTTWLSTPRRGCPCCRNRGVFTYGQRL